MRRNVTLWLLALLMTLLSVAWQRLSGPTHDLAVQAELGGATVRGRLLRTHSTSYAIPVFLAVQGDSVKGRVLWRRLRSQDDWISVPMTLGPDGLRASLPAQPTAGKIEYRLAVSRNAETRLLPADEAVVARFKDDVPRAVLAPHILFMFLAMLWSSRAGLEALTRGPAQRRQAWVTCGLLAVGGLLLGPIVQKYAFGAYWTGWPVGEDLTDNKLAVAALVWLIAAWRSRSRGGRGLILAAAALTLIIFAIPHSIHGSTLDYETMETISG